MQEPVAVGTWASDEDFPIFPVGTKRKRALICPNTPPKAFLIGAHCYLFKVSAGWRINQHWSEAIAFQVASLVGFPVAPCFVAFDETAQSAGVIVEFFYGHPGQGVPRRFIFGADFVKRTVRHYDQRSGRRNTVVNNMRISRALRVPAVVEYWGANLRVRRIDWKY